MTTPLGTSCCFAKRLPVLQEHVPGIKYSQKFKLRIIKVMPAKSNIYPLLAIMFLLAVHVSCIAQFPYSESFRNTTALGVVLGGAAKN